MIILIDNYDSFSYNLYQFIGAINPDIRVVRNDELTVKQIFELNPSHIIISPGPGRPSDAGVCEEVVKKTTHIPLLGVCLGHQAICEAYGARITYAKQLMHGKQSDTEIDVKSALFRGMDGRIRVARYHSLAAEEQSIPTDVLKVTARTADGEIMAVEHKTLPVYGVQFHPESVLTPDGMRIISNFLEIN